MKLFFLLGSISLFTTCRGQNLIPNSGFEYSSFCPNKPNQITKASGWRNPTKGSPDYYNACAGKDYSVPKNRYGVKVSFEGKAYAALNGRRNYREYIQIRLKSPLEKGQKYFCSIRISACDVYRYVSSDIGMLFTKEKIKRADYFRIDGYEPQIENDPDSIFIDYQWHEIKGYFTAKGGEEYLTIGSFKKIVSKVKMINIHSDDEPSWYNFIDNITTEPIYWKKPKKRIQSELSQQQNITFENSSYELDTVSFTELRAVLRILKRNKEVSIKVIGHTDNNGSKISNKILSVQRCLAVKQFLVKHGILNNRIKIEGKGDSDPLLPNTTDDNRIKNRRVEFRVI